MCVFQTDTKYKNLLKGKRHICFIYKYASHHAKALPRLSSVDMHNTRFISHFLATLKIGPQLHQLFHNIWDCDIYNGPHHALQGPWQGCWVWEKEARTTSEAVEVNSWPETPPRFHFKHTSVPMQRSNACVGVFCAIEVWCNIHWCQVRTTW